MNADLRESVARAREPLLFGDDAQLAHRIASPFTVEHARKIALDAAQADIEEILRAIADAGPTNAMVRAAAEEIEQGVKDYACDDMDGGGFVTVEQAVEIARSALSAALKEMG